MLLGINWTAEAIYSKTMNDILYENLAYEQTGRTLGEVYGSAGVPVEDNRPLFSKVTAGVHIQMSISLATPQRVTQ